MWACPTAVRRCALPTAGAARASASGERAAEAVPPMSWTSMMSSASSRAAAISSRRAERSGSSVARSMSTSRSMASPKTFASKTATSMRPSTWRGSVPAVSRSPRAVGRNPCSMTAGLPAASRKTWIGSPPEAGAATRNHRFIGWMPLRATPSASYSSPSAWKPGPSPRKPRSTTTSTTSPANVTGTSPTISNHHVDHGSPQARPGPTRSKPPEAAHAMASATGTGSPGTCQAEMVSGIRSRWTAGVTCSASTLRARASTWALLSNTARP
jgi:hypothetical protein